MEDNGKLKTLVFGIVAGTNKRGRPWREWMDDTVSWCKTGLQELNSLAQDRRRWKLITRQAMDTNGRWSHGRPIPKEEEKSQRSPDWFHCNVVVGGNSWLLPGHHITSTTIGLVRNKYVLSWLLPGRHMIRCHCTRWAALSAHFVVSLPHVL